MARLPGSCSWCDGKSTELQLIGQNAVGGGFLEDLDGILLFRACFTLLGHYQDTWFAHRNPLGSRWSIQNIFRPACSFFLIEDVETEVLNTLTTKRWIEFAAQQYSFEDKQE